MELDQFGFPKPAEFEDRPARAARGGFTPGRFALLILVLLIGGLAAAVAEYGPDVMKGLSQQLARLHLNRDETRLLLARMDANMSRGNYDAALRDATRLVRKRPDAPEFRFIRAQVFLQLKRYSEAVADYTELLRREPNSAPALNNRAWCRALARTELLEALKDVDQAIDLAGPNVAYIDTRGYLNYLLGRFDEALVDFNRVLNQQRAEEIDHERVLGEIYFHRGLLYRQLGKHELAKKDFERARENDFVITEFPPPVARPVAAKPKGPRDGKQAPLVRPGATL